MSSVAGTQDVTVVLNAVSARRGGGLMVYRALLSDSAVYGNVRFVVIANSEAAYAELSAQAGAKVTVVRVPKALQNLAVYGQRFVVNRVVREHGAALVVSQNYFVEGCAVPQIVLHVNVFSFVRNPYLRGLAVLKERLRQRAARIALAKAAANVFESHHLRSLAESRPEFDSSTSHVLYIGVDSAGKRVDARGAVHRPPRVAVVTSDNPHKRNEILAHAAAEAARLLPESPPIFTVFGGGDWDDLKAQAKIRGVAEQFDFRGYVAGKDLGNQIGEALCLVTASRFESFCSVAVEAMIRGVPAIVPDTSSMPESVGKAGLALPEDGLAVGMGEEIRRLFTEDEYRLRRVRDGLEHASTLTWSDAVCRFSAILDTTLSRSGRADTVRTT